MMLQMRSLLRSEQSADYEDTLEFREVIPLGQGNPRYSKAVACADPDKPFVERCGFAPIKFHTSEDIG
jgi:hypothetical protein